jgi:hypothetical protein
MPATTTDLLGPVSDMVGTNDISEDQYVRVFRSIAAFYLPEAVVNVTDHRISVDVSSMRFDVDWENFQQLVLDYCLDGVVSLDLGSTTRESTQFFTDAAAQGLIKRLY